MSIDDNGVGSIVKQLRLRADLSRVQLGAASGVSASHLNRIENGQRFPSAKVLRKIAPHLNIGEMELLVLAGYVSADPYGMLGDAESAKLDPYVVALLSQEPVEVQRVVISIFSMMKYVASGIAYEQTRVRNNSDLVAIPWRIKIGSAISK
ncbi:MAG TPA: helix-turn-helix transcriptional regulator [Dehalococcoidia bacterium]|nr:helix-turn-helix transcriptional regulator [Dehalococcoidia bacterium]